MSKLFQGGTNQENTNPQVKVKYPRNFIQTTSAGHCIEMNNTPEGERVRIINANGNFFDMDQKNNTNLVCKNDTIVLSDHNLVIKVGTDVDTDRLCLQVIGDVNLYVEGDMHTEVEGDRYDTVNGNWQQECKGVWSMLADENMSIRSENQMKLESNSYENKTTFLLNDLSEGGSIKENVKGNYEVKIDKPSSTYSIRSEGDIRTEAQKCRYEYIKGNRFSHVEGKDKLIIDGGDKECIEGGAFEGMDTGVDPNAYKIGVTVGGMNAAVTGIYSVQAATIDMDAGAIYLN